MKLIQKLKVKKPQKSLSNLKSTPFSKRSLLVYAIVFAIVAGGYGVYKTFAAPVNVPVRFYTYLCPSGISNPSQCSNLSEVRVETADGGSSVFCNPWNDITKIVPSDNGRARVTLQCPSATDGKSSRQFSFITAVRSGYNFSFARETKTGASVSQRFISQGTNFTVKPGEEIVIEIGMTPATSTPTNHDPIGHFGGITADGTAVGWACDPDAFSTPLSIHFYVDGAAGTGTYAGLANANIDMHDAAVGSHCGGYVAHWFEWKIPNSLRNDKPRTLWAHPINANGGNNPVLDGSPKQFKLAPLPVINSFKINGGGSASVYEGSNVTLAWSTTSTSSCTITGVGTTSVAINTTAFTTKPTLSLTAYTLTCTNANGIKTTKSVAVKVNQPSLGISMDKSSVLKGTSALLKWTGLGVNYCEASNSWSGQRTLSGSAKIIPASSRTYTMSCRGLNNTTWITKSVKITVRNYKISSNKISPVKPCRNTTATYSAEIVKYSGAPVEGVTVKFKVYYKSKTVTYTAGKTNANGVVSKKFKVTNDQGYKVKVKTSAINGTNTVSGSTSFTPKKCG